MKRQGARRQSASAKLRLGIKRVEVCSPLVNANNWNSFANKTRNYGCRN